jgi:hypothetical protein
MHKLPEAARIELNLVEIDTGTKKPIVVTISASAPADNKPGAFFSEVSIGIILEQPKKIYGDDSIHALLMAIGFAERMLVADRENLEVQWPDGNKYDIHIPI